MSEAMMVVTLAFFEELVVEAEAMADQIHGEWCVERHAARFECVPPIVKEARELYDKTLLEVEV